MIKKSILSAMLLLLSCSTIAGTIKIENTESAHFSIWIADLFGVVWREKIRANSNPGDPAIVFDTKKNDVVCIAVMNMEDLSSIKNYYFEVISNKDMGSAITWKGTFDAPEYDNKETKILKLIKKKSSKDACIF